MYDPNSVNPSTAGAVGVSFPWPSEGSLKNPFTKGRVVGEKAYTFI